MKINRIKRNQKIQSEYKRLYEVDGKRHTVICKELGEQFFLTPDYISDIIKMELPDLEKES